RGAVTGAAPRVLVRAWRQAFASPDPAEEIRVTFDRRVGFQPTRGPSFDHDPDGWIPIDGEPQHGRRGPHVLLEMKFPRVAPLWMQRLVEKLGLRRISYSKYVSAERAVDGQASLDALVLGAVRGPRS